MSNGKHTPGPLRVRAHRIEHSDDVLDYDIECDAADHNPNGEIVGCAYTEADAYLFAAAPDLLEALEEMTDEIVKYGFAKATSPMASGARAAIAKAKGETK